eukprot:11479_2
MTTKSEQQGYCSWKGSATVEMTAPTVSTLWNSLVLFFVELQWLLCRFSLLASSNAPKTEVLPLSLSVSSRTLLMLVVQLLILQCKLPMMDWQKRNI